MAATSILSIGALVDVSTAGVRRGLIPRLAGALKASYGVSADLVAWTRLISGTLHNVVAVGNVVK